MKCAIDRHLKVKGIFIYSWPEGDLDKTSRNSTSTFILLFLALGKIITGKVYETLKKLELWPTQLDAETGHNRHLKRLNLMDPLKDGSWPTGEHKRRLVKTQDK